MFPQQLGTATFTGKAEYIGGVLGAPPVEGITTIEILVAGCSKILWYFPKSIWSSIALPGVWIPDIKSFHVRIPAQPSRWEVEEYRSFDAVRS